MLIEMLVLHWHWLFVVIVNTVQVKLISIVLEHNSFPSLRKQTQKSGWNLHLRVQKKESCFWKSSSGFLSLSPHPVKFIWPTGEIYFTVHVFQFLAVFLKNRNMEARRLQNERSAGCLWRNSRHTAVSLFKKMYLYVLTYWCQKIMHQKCHIDSQLQRKSIFFFFNYKYWKNYVQKKGMVTRVHEKETYSHTIWFMRLLQIKIPTVTLS